MNYHNYNNYNKNVAYTPTIVFFISRFHLLLMKKITNYLQHNFRPFLFSHPSE